MLYNPENEKIFLESQMRVLDGATGIVTQSNLIHSSKEIFQQKFKDLTLWETGLVRNNEGGWNKSIESLKITPKGSYKSALGRHDIGGIISLTGESKMLPVDVRDAESSYSIYDQKTTALQGLSISQKLRMSHNEVYRDDVDKIGYLGDETLSSKGLINADWGIVVKTGKDWTAMTNKEIADAIRDLYIQQTVGVGIQSLYGNVMIVPQGLYIRLRVDDYKDYGDTTLLQKIERDLKLKIVTTYRAEKVADFGDSDCAVIISTDRYAQQFRLPIPLQFTPNHKEGHKTKFTSYYGVAGLDILNDCGARLEFRA